MSNAVFCRARKSAMLAAFSLQESLVLGEVERFLFDANRRAAFSERIAQFVQLRFLDRMELHLIEEPQ